MKETSERLLEFATSCFKLTNRLSSTMSGRYIANQLMRSSASAGANYQEACGAETRPDFTHKMQIVLKELRESDFWLQLVGQTGIAPETVWKPLQAEAVELVKIFAKSVVTLKTRPPNSREQRAKSREQP
jgi:four helix bundle protein